MPDTYTTTAGGTLLIANGVDPVLRWDGRQAEAEPAGVDAPGDGPSLAGSGSGSITGTYYAYLRFVDRDGNPSNLSPVSASAALASAATVTYSGLAAPAQAKVARRQVLRNTAGQTAVFYVDIDTDDLTSDSLSSTQADAALATGEAVALFTSEGAPLANAHAPPPSHKPYVAQHQDRVFLGGEGVVRRGCVATTLGSAAVSGLGTEWPASLAGRYLHVAGATRSYEILSVDVSAQTLALAETWGQASLPYAEYAIRPAPAERRLVWYSGAGDPEGYSAAQAAFIPEDGDQITGLFALSSWLFVAERRHVYRLTFQDDPALDGGVFLASRRGLINHRCAVEVEGQAYLLDECGVHVMGPEGADDAISQPVQSLFEPQRLSRSPGRDRLRIRWEFADQFHAAFDQSSATVRWFVSLTGAPAPRHALCLDIRRRAWWVEEYAWPVGASCAGALAGQPAVFLGGPPGRVATLQGSLDGVDPTAGTHRGTATGAGPLTLSDSSASFPADLAGRTVTLVSGAGKTQTRRIASSSATELALVLPWAILPAAGDAYQIGGVQWRYATGWYAWADSELEAPRNLEVSYEPASAGTFDCRLYYDRSRTPVLWGSTQVGVSDGSDSEEGAPDLVADLTKANGYSARRFDRQGDLYLDADRMVAVELRGVAGAEPVVVYQLAIGGARG